jgi:hypothetical protein
MTFADQLRAIAERLDEAERLRGAALDDLTALTVDANEQLASLLAGSDGAATDESPMGPAPIAPIEAPSPDQVHLEGTPATAIPAGAG